MVGNLLSSHLPSSNRQAEEILAIHLLVANLNSGPFSDLWQLGALDSVLNLLLVVIVADAMWKGNLWKWEVNGNKTVSEVQVPISCEYTKAHGRSCRICYLEVLCWFEIVDDPPLASKLWNLGYFLVCDLVLFGVKEDKVSPTCPTCKASNIEYIAK